MMMLVAYGAVIVFGMNEFRKAPLGFIPQVDRGYLIVAAQLPPGTLLVGDDVGPRYRCDWTGRQPHRPLAVARPATTDITMIVCGPIVLDQKIRAPTHVR